MADEGGAIRTTPPTPLLIPIGVLWLESQLEPMAVDAPDGVCEASGAGVWAGDEAEADATGRGSVYPAQQLKRKSFRKERR